MNLVSREKLLKSNIDLTEDVKRLEGALKEIIDVGTSYDSGRDAMYLVTIAKDALKTHRLRVVKNSDSIN